MFTSAKLLFFKCYSEFFECYQKFVIYSSVLSAVQLAKTQATTERMLYHMLTDDFVRF